MWKSDPISVPVNTKISYKYLRYNGGVFESWESPHKSSHSLFLNSCNKTVVNDVFGSYSHSDNNEKPSSAIKRTTSSEPLKSKANGFGSCPILPKSAVTSPVPPAQRTVILVAYRLPVIISRSEGGEWNIKWDYENMYLFSEQNLSDHNSVWWCGALTYLHTNDIFNQNDHFTATDMIQLKQRLFKMHCLPIFLDSELNHFYYNGYCKSILSPMLHGCTMVYDDPETQFSWQKNTAEVITYQNAYRRVNNLFAQEILRYCQQLQVLDKETIIWINGYHLMLLPRDLRLYLANLKHSASTAPPSQTPNLYTSGSLASSASVLSPTNDITVSPFSSLSPAEAERCPSRDSFASDSEPESLFSPGPAFVDNLDDDMDDERLRQLYAMSSQDPMVEYDGEEDEELPERSQIQMKIIFFLHMPFPSYEIFRQLPLRTSILRGILASDLIGTHTYSSARHIISSCCRHLGVSEGVQPNSNLCLQWGSRSVCVYISHVGLDGQYMESILQSSTVHSHYEEYLERYANRLVIAGVDELYQTNAIRYKIQAFHKLLQEFPAYRSRLILVQVCYRRRSALLGQQRTYELQIQEAANACNAQFPGSVDLQMLTGSFFPIHQRMALWRIARIYLNTSLAQGLNLHPQEFLMARKEAGGVVIVSEFANAHEFLNGALSVNPWDISSIVGQLEKAVEMGESEVKLRQTRDIDNIVKREKRLWCSHVIQNLLDSSSEDPIQIARVHGDMPLTDDDVNSLTQHLEHSWVKEVYQRAASRFFILDYGGTLQSKEGFNRDLKDDFQGVLQRPPSAAMSRVLQRLCDDPKNQVWVVSSSGSMVVQKTLGSFRNMGLIAVNGLKVRYPGSLEWTPSPEYRKKPLPYCKEIVALCQDYVFQTNGSTLYHDNYVVRYHYQYCDPDLGKQMADKLVSELQELLRDVSVKIVHDVGVVEVRSFLGTRGAIVKTLLQQYKEEHQADPEMVFCMGDSMVDEPMFGDVQNMFRMASNDETEPEVITCTVGQKASRAQYFTTSVQEDYHLFALLTDPRKAG